MKKFIILFTVFLLLISSCAIMLFQSDVKSATMKEAYDFVNEVADGDFANADVIIEPWSQYPALQLVNYYGDSTNMLFDMGNVSIETAKGMSLSDGKTGYDEWDAYPIEENHVYTFLNQTGDRVFMLIKNVDMSTYTDDYKTEISFDYEVVK